MAHPLVRRSLAVLVVALAVACLAVPAPACPFCTMQGQTLVADVKDASLVLYGTFTNARLDAGVDGQGTTDLEIEAVLKKNDILGDQKSITLPKYVPNKDGKYKFLVFCDVFKGKIDPYRGIAVAADCDMVKYMKGALEVKDKDIGARLRFYFDYLDDKEPEISNDAFKEFGNADYKDYHDLAKKLPADKIAKWLQDPNTPSFRYGLYASMLGHCGTVKHAEVLRKMLDNPQKRISSGVDGILAGYMMLQPKEGWAYTRALLKDPAKEFTLRYAALRTVRFFLDFRLDLIGQKEMIQGVCDLLDQSDIADLAIEDLRKWGRWELSDRVLGLLDQKSHDVPIIRRAILRYALSSPEEPAKELVAKWRKKDNDMVQDAEELLKLEVKPPAPPAPKTPVVAGKQASSK